MSDLSIFIAGLPPEQQAIRAKCFHPSGAFVEFKKQEIEQSISERFEKMVAKYPGRVAVKTKHYELTYNELNKAVNRVGRAILAQRGQGNEPVALLLKNDAPMIVAIVGALKAGKLFVPLDSSSPQARNSYILEDSQAELIVTDNENISLALELAHSGRRVINVDKIDTGAPEQNLGLSISPDSLAYILYTSGSTGQPKGVVQNHRNVLHKIMNYTNSSHICMEDRLALLVSLGFSAAVTNMFAALLNGATLGLFDLREENVTKLANWLIQQEITVYQSVTLVFRYFLDTLAGNEEFSNLRLIDLFSEPVSTADIERYLRHFSRDCILRNRLASTETGDVCHYFINKESRVTESIVPIGYVIEGMKVLLLDDDGKVVGFNQVGEIAVQSRNLALGYWRNPALSEASFLPDPKGSDQRIYLTGDLGRMLPDTCLVHLGRKDSRVKIRGYRIEVPEIEMTLAKHAGVKEAVVVAEDDFRGEKRLLAYVVLHEQRAPTTSELRGFLAEKLPDYMVPSAFVLLDALPLTSRGKVNRSALPAPDQTRPELKGAFVAPHTLVKKILADIWAEVLGLEHIGVHDNFFNLGGHSLSATQILSRLRDSFQVDLPPRILLDRPTIEQLAEAVEQSWVENHEGKDLDILLADLESLSEEEARRSLADAEKTSLKQS